MLLQIIICKTLQRKLKIEQHEPHNEKFEDTKRVTRGRSSKMDRKCNAQKEKGQKDTQWEFMLLNL
jgi:hypothetical protein